MTIRDKHLYHGAVLNQIAEHPQFTAINALKIAGEIVLNAFKVNDDIVVYLKYRRDPTATHGEYVFGFSPDNLSELERIHDAGNDLHLALVCVSANEVCCFPYDQMTDLVAARKQEVGFVEPQYSILVTLNEGESFRVSMNAPGVKNAYIKRPVIVPRTACPNALFR